MTQNYIAVFTDNSVIKQHEAELDRIAHYDHLTGLPNRRLFADRLSLALARNRRSGMLLAVCYLDLDGFKPVNDQYGHDVGDQLLVAITRELQGVLRAGDTVARLGGDEFVLLFTDLSRPEDHIVLLDRVLNAASSQITVGGVKHRVSASIGVTLCPPDADDPDALLRHADQAMYRAKEAGKNCYHLYGPERDRLARDRRLELDRLGVALERGEFVLHYQPAVDLLSRQVMVAEALIRWQHPEKGLLAPAAFLPRIEGSELEVGVGEWVIETALRQIAVWHQQGLNLMVSVNVAAYHLLQPDFACRLGELLARHPELRASDLQLEIVETAALSDVEQARCALAVCKQQGVRFALDDFGTGYSSLSYLRNLPIDALKIDQSFVRGMLENPSDMGIVDGIVKLARAFDRRVIAEGAETAGHCAALAQLGCHFGQGYGIAHPMPAEEFPQWVADWSSKASTGWLNR